MGRAMMGSAEAGGIDRARIAAEQAAVSPLLEGTELSGARCVLINITASRGLKMSEVRDAVKTVQAFAAQEAFVKYGTVFEESMGDRMRVTVVATGLSNNVTRVPLQIVEAPPKTAAIDPGAEPDYRQFERPPAMRNARQSAGAGAGALGGASEDYFDIPAFLRRQAD